MDVRYQLGRGTRPVSDAHETRAESDTEVIAAVGSGERIRFPRPAWLRPLAERGIGLETMDTAAACRTYNILAQEGRQVAVALLLEQPH